MFTEWLRGSTKGILDPVAEFFFRLGIGANALTFFGGLLNIGVGVLVAFGYAQWGGLLLAFASVFDALDGTLARRAGKATKFGAFLDSVLDRVSESAILLGIAVWFMQQPGLVDEILAFVAIVGSLMVSYTRARAEGLGVSCKVGVLTRVERCIMLIVALLLNLLRPVVWVLALGTVVTAAHRVIHVYTQTKGETL